MKPTAPLPALPCSGMKPLSPLRAMKGHFWAISTLQRCCRFQWGVQRGLQRCCRFQWGAQCGLQRCCWFQSCPVFACYARKSSPCAAWCGCEREKVRPACSKWPKIGVLWRAGRSFSRNCCETGRAGRSFRGTAAKRAVPGEVFRGWPLKALCWAKFFAELLRNGPCRAKFFADEPLKALCRAKFFAEEPLKAIMGNVSMCVRSPCGASHQPGRNFACNSPQGMSHHELKSLRFCCFVPRVDAGSAGIACDFCGAGELCFEHWLDDGY